MAKSIVFYIKIKNTDNLKQIQNNFTKLITESKILDVINNNTNATIKMHLGEEGNTGFINPIFIKILSEMLKNKNVLTTVSETNTLYKGRRTNSEDHLKLAYEHGFTKHNIGIDVVIPDDNDENNTVTININQHHIKQAKIISYFIKTDFLIGVSHFKGHIMTGFGGALKNIGMGCATRKGKLEQHSDLSPIVMKEMCTGCQNCITVCPVNAISFKNNTASINNSLCIGCTTCIAVCHAAAIDIQWESGANLIQEKMIEYTEAVLQNKKNKMLFINFATKITKECDCLAKDDPRICPDVGIFISRDPVSIDKACLDLVIKTAGKDIFKEVHPQRDGIKQLEYAHKLDLGNLHYELVEIK